MVASSSAVGGMDGRAVAIPCGIFHPKGDDADDDDDDVVEIGLILLLVTDGASDEI